MSKIAPTIAFAIAIVAADAGAAQVAGYGRDGTRIYPEVTPPTTWTEKGVLWETPLPSWGTGSPSYVAGKLLVFCEPAPGFDFPLLVCLDAKTGKQLWRREVDHLPATAPSESEQQAVRKAWHVWLTDFYERQRFRIRYERVKDTEGDAKAKLDAEMKANGWTYGRLVAPAKGHEKASLKELWQKAGILTNVSQHHQYCNLNAVGLAYGTPTSDGEAVYVHTAHGAVAAYDLDGRLKWMAWAKGDSSNEGCNAGRSLLLWDDPKSDARLVLSDIVNRVMALDRRTGKTLWCVPTDCHTIVSPMVLNVGGTEILWAAGCRAFRLPDGKELKVEGWKDAGMQTLVKHDERDVVFFCGAGEHCGWTGKGRSTPPHPPAAVRFALKDDDTLKATVLWHGGTIAEVNGLKSIKSALGGNRPWMLYNDGKFYHTGGAILDAASGKVVAGAFVNKRNRRASAVPETSHLLCLANGHVYGFSGRGRPGTCEVFTANGRRVASNPVPWRPTPAELDIMAACGGIGSDENDKSSRRLDNFSYGSTFTFGGSRIYFRSWTSIVCIGPKMEGTPRR